METNNIINIPEGFEIDKKQLNYRQIENQRARSWEEYCEQMQGKPSFMSFSGDACIESVFTDMIPIIEFDNKEDLEAFAAYSKLLKMRKQWIGDWTPDWTSEDPKFIILTNRNNIEGSVCYRTSSAMSFPTKEMCDEFLDCFKDLLEIAKPLL